MGGTTPSRCQALPPKLRPLGLALALVLAGIVYAALDPKSGIRTWQRLEGEVAEAQRRIDGLRVRNARLRRDVEALEEDPSALERAIREEIGWVRPGEIRISLSKGDPPALP